MQAVAPWVGAHGRGPSSIPPTRRRAPRAYNATLRVQMRRRSLTAARCNPTHGLRVVADVGDGPSTSASAPSKHAAIPAAGGQGGAHWRRVTNEQVEIHRRAKTAQAHGRIQAALSILHAGLRSYPDDTHLLSLAASLEAKLGNRERSEALLARGLALYPQHLALLTTAARLHATCGEYEEARKLFGTAHAAHPGEAAVLQAWAMMEASAGNERAARTKFFEALARAPAMPHVHCAWAQMEAALGNIQRAREIFEEGNLAVPDHPPLLHAWAELESGQGRVLEARRLLEHAVNLCPGHVPSWMALGKVEWMAGNCDRARQVWQHGNVRAGPSAQLLHAWARRELSAGGPAARQRARQLVAGALNADPRHGPSLTMAAALEDRSGASEKADAAYADAEQTLLTPRDADPRKSMPDVLALASLLHARAQQALRRGQRDVVEVLLARLEELQPGNPHGCHTRGLLAMSEGRTSDAEAHFMRGLGGATSRKRPAAGMPSVERAGTLLNFEALGNLHAFRGNSIAAQETFAAGLRAACGRPTARFLRQYALLEKRCGYVDHAAELYGRAARLEPHDPKTWLQWGVLERRRRHFEAAEACFQRGVAAAPAHPHLWYAYTTMQWRLGKVEQARTLFQQATKLCPRNPPLWMEWALMEWSQGDVDHARQLFRQGASVPARFQHPPLYEAWSRMEEEDGDSTLAAQLLDRSQAMRGIKEEAMAMSLPYGPQ